MSSLDAALRVDREGLVKRFLAVNEYHGSNANFVISSLMVDSLKRGYGICLVSLHNSISHYHHVLTKMSALNLGELKERKTQVEVIELMNDLREHAYCNKECFHEFWEDQNFSMKQLFSVIRKKVETLLKTQSSVCLIIDDTSHFIDMGVSVKDILSLIQYCRTLFSIFPKFSLVVLNHVISEDDTSVLAVNVAHFADTVVNISALKTGHSNDVSGLLEVKYKQIDSTSSHQWNNSSLFHFKVMDRHVKLFAPGTSMFRT